MLTLTFILGHVAAATASLPLACDSDGGCSNRSDIHASSVSGSGSVRVISSAIGGDNRLVRGNSVASEVATVAATLSAVSRATPGREEAARASSPAASGT